MPNNQQEQATPRAERPLDLVRVSKSMSHALRHAPDQYGLTLSSEGFVELGDLVAGLNAQRRWPRELTAEDLEAAANHGPKRRFEIAGTRIRARYGHSVKQHIEHVAQEPPAQLYHGTPERNLASIYEKGLLPMGRQTVHLSVDEPTARTVGSRHHGPVAILLVNAAQAHADGIKFYPGNDGTWLADAIPPQYLSRLE